LKSLLSISDLAVYFPLPAAHPKYPIEDPDGSIINNLYPSKTSYAASKAVEPNGLY